MTLIPDNGLIILWNLLNLPLGNLSRFMNISI